MRNATFDFWSRYSKPSLGAQRTNGTVPTAANVATAHCSRGLTCIRVNWLARALQQRDCLRRVFLGSDGSETSPTILLKLRVRMVVNSVDVAVQVDTAHACSLRSTRIPFRHGIAPRPSHYSRSSIYHELITITMAFLALCCKNMMYRNTGSQPRNLDTFWRWSGEGSHQVGPRDDREDTQSCGRMHGTELAISVFWGGQQPSCACSGPQSTGNGAARRAWPVFVPLHSQTHSGARCALCSICDSIHCAHA